MGSLYLDDNEPNKEFSSFKILIADIKSWIKLLRTKFKLVILIGTISALLFYAKSFIAETKYVATLSFSLEEERQGGVTGAFGLASSLGIDLGSGNSGGLFASNNIIELMKSKLVIRKALSQIIHIGDVKSSLGGFYITFSKRIKDNENNYGTYNSLFNLEKNDRKTDSIFNLIYDDIINNGVLSVYQKDKKVSIITIQVISTNEIFSKEFTESIVDEVSTFYIETKSKKAKLNYQILEKQTDSIRRELSGAITGVALGTDNTYNLNPALNIKRVNTTKRQIDVQANTAILTQLVTNLEMAKVSLRKETPLIQIIDSPTFPLVKKSPNKILNSIIGFLVGIFLTSVYFIGKRKLQDLFK